MANGVRNCDMCIYHTTEGCRAWTCDFSTLDTYRDDLGEGIMNRLSILRKSYEELDNQEAVYAIDKAASEVKQFLEDLA